MPRTKYPKGRSSGIGRSLIVVECRMCTAETTYKMESVERSRKIRCQCCEIKLKPMADGRGQLRLATVVDPDWRTLVVFVCEDCASFCEDCRYEEDRDE